MNIFTAGTWDLVHPGHVALINNCRYLAGHDGNVIVSVNTDEFVERFKNRRPIMSTKDRMTMMSALSGVDIVVKNTGEEYIEKTIENVEEKYGFKIDLIVIGSDWHSKDYLSQLHTNWDYLGEKGIGICYYQYSPGVSTTEIKKRINARSV